MHMSSWGYSDLITMSKNSVLASKVPVFAYFSSRCQISRFLAQNRKMAKKQSKKVQKQLILVRITNVYALQASFGHFRAKYCPKTNFWVQFSGCLTTKNVENPFFWPVLGSERVWVCLSQVYRKGHQIWAHQDH